MKIVITIIMIAGCLIPASLNAQTLTRKEALQLAQEKNPKVQLANLRKEKQQILKSGAIRIESPEVIFEAPTSNQLRPGVLQSIEFPSVYVRKYQAQEQQVRLAETEKQITLNELRYKINMAYTEQQYLNEVFLSYQQQDSLLADFVEVTDVRLQVGQISNLERLNAESQYREVKYQLGQVTSRLRTSRMQMGLLIGDPGDTSLRVLDAFAKAEVPDAVILAQEAFINNPQTTFFEQQKEMQQLEVKISRNSWMPNLIVGYLNQGTVESPLAYRMRYGFTVPLWFWSNTSTVKAKKREVKIAEQQMVLNQYQLQGNYNQALSELKQFTEALNYFEQTGLPQAEEIAKSARESYRLGSIGYYNYLLNLQQVIKIRLGYLEALKNFNEAIYTIQYLKGE